MPDRSRPGAPFDGDRWPPRTLTEAELDAALHRLHQVGPVRRRSGGAEWGETAGLAAARTALLSAIDGDRAGGTRLIAGAGARGPSGPAAGRGRRRAPVWLVPALSAASIVVLAVVGIAVLLPNQAPVRVVDPGAGPPGQSRVDTTPTPGPGCGLGGRQRGCSPGAPRPTGTGDPAPPGAAIPVPAPTGAAPPGPGPVPTGPPAPTAVPAPPGAVPTRGAGPAATPPRAPVPSAAAPVATAAPG
jgi:hypothetical protein